MSPRRERTQVLAEEAVRAFVDVLPSSWIKREESPDYGIDVDVELAEEGRPTSGHRFHAQIKGTDSNNDPIIDVQYYKLEWLEYYRELAQPVLLVRYSSVRRSLKCRWAHSVNLHAGQGEVPKVRVDFRDTVAFSVADSHRIQRDVLSYRYWKESIPNLPIRIAVVSDEIPIGRRVVRMLQNAPTRPHSLLAFKLGSPQIDEPRLDVEGSLIRVSAADIASMSIDVPEPFEKLDPVYALRLVRLLLAVVLSQLNRPTVAHAALPENLGLILGMYPASAHRVAELLWESGRVDEIFSLWDEFAAVPHGDEVVWQLMGGLFHIGARLDPQTEDALRKAVDSWKNTLLARSDVANAAQGALAEGVFLFETGHHRDALWSLIQACRLSPDISDMPFYKQHLAAALFETRRLRLAVTLYQKIYALTGDARSLCRLADCLLFAGEYVVSRQRFDEAFEVAARQEQHIESIWILRHQVATKGAESFAGQTRESLLAAEALERGQLEEAIERDFLCSEAWAALGHRQLDDAQYGSARDAFKIAAAIDKNNVDAIAHAVNLTIGSQPEESGSLLPLLDLGARSIGVAQFLEMVDEDLSRQVPEHAVDAQRAIRELIDEWAGLWGPVENSRPDPLFVIPLLDEEE